MDTNLHNNENEMRNLDQNHPFAVAMRLNAMRRGMKWMDTYQYSSQNLKLS